MSLNLEFTDKAQATLQAAIQLAKDYANSQCMSGFILYTLTPCAYQVYLYSISRTPRVCALE
jgi:hypothetical protein